jgi:hypothetical protein
VINVDKQPLVVRVGGQVGGTAVNDALPVDADAAVQLLGHEPVGERGRAPGLMRACCARSETEYAAQSAADVVHEGSGQMAGR